MIYITNAFSINMLNVGAGKLVTIEPISATLVSAMLRHEPYTSAVGHADTAEVFSSTLGERVICNRTSLKLEKGTHIIVGQYVGPRLPEGTKTLPDGATIEWYEVKVF